ncbi:MAG TPA: type II secretion system protein GspN [Deltaproteobacteria bacterium]|nr:type II secretion system protein GspN [Deltaproteobacteria bacterium]
MTESNAAARPLSRGILPKRILVPIVVVLVLFFVALGFPWDSLARRVAWEISEASGSRVSIDELLPAWTARGPVLRARDVSIEHPALDHVRLSQLELAPRWSRSWLGGDPTLRIWAESDLGLVDGVLELGPTPGFVGRVREVELARVPLRLEASDVRISGRLDAETDVALDRQGTLHGRVDFSSPSLRIESDRLPMAIPFKRAEGTLEILENGATRIERAAFEGEIIEGELSGEIGLVHHSQPPPVDLDADARLLHPLLRQLAPGAGIPVGADGSVTVHVSGTLDTPAISPRSDGRRVGRHSAESPARSRP